MATLALALALALKFCLHKRLSNLHLHKVRQLPFAGIWQIDIFSFSAAFYLPSQYFLLLLPENNIIKQRRVRIWGWRLKKWECLLPFVHFSLSTLHLPPCHALVFCSELRDFAGPTFLWGPAQITVEIGPGQLGISTAAVDSRFVSCARPLSFPMPFVFRAYANYSVLCCAIHSNSTFTSSSSASPFFSLLVSCFLCWRHFGYLKSVE